MASVTQLVKNIDKDLKILDSFPNSLTTVLQVQRRYYSQPFILKMGIDFSKPSDKSIEEYIQREEMLLDIAKDLEGITKLVRSYEKSENHPPAILKEYFEGDDVYSQRKLFREDYAKKQITRIVHSLHEIGIANLDIRPQNFVLSSSAKKVKLIDINTAYFYFGKFDFKKYKSFEQAKRSDLFWLDHIFS